MKKTIIKLTAAAALGVALFWACKPKETVDEASAYLPVDVLPSCVVDKTEFNSWFASGSASENGAVKPANSVTFGHKNNCDFYKWSQQMFLWITSPSEGAYGNNGRVFESPVFYTVSPASGPDNQRTLIAHKKGLLLSAVPTLKQESDIDSEESQATGDAIMSKDGAMLYYITMVNDVYAQFLSAADNHYMNPKTFPTTQTDLDSIIAYAAKSKTVLPDAEALAIELKTSWVEASKIKDLSTYMTIDAMIPTYTKTDSLWVISGQQKAKLALIGMHIVGSTAGHPEMVWSTFEHKDNAPNASYTYLNKDNKVVTVAPDTGNQWILNSDPGNPAVNISHMKVSGDSITAVSPYGMTPSNTQRTKPWGVAENSVPNPENATASASNSQMISINNSVMGLLVGNDIRKNYLFIGSTWTKGGAAPDGTSYSPVNTTPGMAIGTSQSANTTMETYIQDGVSEDVHGTCFYCHHSKVPGLAPGNLSHVYSDILPLQIGPGGIVKFLSLTNPNAKINKNKKK